MQASHCPSITDYTRSGHTDWDGYHTHSRLHALWTQLRADSIAFAYTHRHDRASCDAYLCGKLILDQKNELVARAKHLPEGQRKPLRIHYDLLRTIYEQWTALPDPTPSERLHRRAALIESMDRSRAANLARVRDWDFCEQIRDDQLATRLAKVEPKPPAGVAGDTAAEAEWQARTAAGHLYAWGLGYQARTHPQDPHFVIKPPSSWDPILLTDRKLAEQFVNYVLFQPTTSLGDSKLRDRLIARRAAGKYLDPLDAIAITDYVDSLEAKEVTRD